MLVCRAITRVVLAAGIAVGVVGQLFAFRTADEKRYDGITLREWQHRLGYLDPKDSDSESVVHALIEIINDDDLPASTRRPFAVTLGRMGPRATEAIPSLIDKIQRRHVAGDESYIWAARALGLYGVHAKPAVPALVDLLFDESIPRGYRQLPLESLAQVGTAHPAVLPALIRLLEYRPPATSELSAADASVLREFAAEALTIIGQESYLAAPLLVRVVRDPSETENVRRKAIVALGAMGGGASVAVPALTETMEFEPSEQLRAAAAEALPKIGPAALPVLRQYLQHERAELRRLAAEGLRQMGQGASGAVVELLRCLNTDDDLLRIACCEALHGIGIDSSRYAEPLVSLLASEDRQVRMRAMRLLVTLGQQLGPHLESLRRMQDDPRPHARAIARKTLQKIEN
jgi:HEAT repeat protein